MMNPYAIIAALVLAAAAIGGAYWQGRNDGRDACEALQAREDAVRQETRELAQQGAADAIGKLEVKHVTIKQKLEREVREKTVFAECRSGPDSVRIYNSGVAGGAESAGGSELPTSNPSR